MILKNMVREKNVIIFTYSTSYAMHGYYTAQKGTKYIVLKVTLLTSLLFLLVQYVEGQGYVCSAPTN